MSTRTSWIIKMLLMFVFDVKIFCFIQNFFLLNKRPVASDMNKNFHINNTAGKRTSTNAGKANGCEIFSNI